MLLQLTALLFLFLVADPSFSQLPFLSGCPNINVMKSFDPEAYLGLWYEYEKYPFIFEIGGRCITAEYTLKSDGKIGVTNRQINRILGNENSITGYAEIVEPGKLTVRFPSLPGRFGAPYWILGTDYQNYAVIFSCAEFGGIASARMVWILTRDRQPRDSYVEKAYDILDAQNISRTFLMKTDQSNCPEESGKITHLEQRY